MRHNKTRFKLSERVKSARRRRKGVEFFAGLSSGSYFLFRKRNPFDKNEFHNNVPDQDSSKAQPELEGS